jgi:hypothetical protein
MIYPEKLSSKIDGAVKTFQNKHKLKQIMTTKPTLQKKPKEITQEEEEEREVMKMRAQERMNFGRGEDKHTKINKESNMFNSANQKNHNIIRGKRKEQVLKSTL